VQVWIHLQIYFVNHLIIVGVLLVPTNLESVVGGGHCTHHHVNFGKQCFVAVYDHPHNDLLSADIHFVISIVVVLFSISVSKHMSKRWYHWLVCGDAVVGIAAHALTNLPEYSFHPN